MHDLPKAVATADANFRQTKPADGEGKTTHSKGKGKAKKEKHKEKCWKAKDKGKVKVVEQSKGKDTKTFTSCSICGGPHRANDCPKREKLNTMVAENSNTSDDACEDDPTRVDPLRLMSNAIGKSLQV